MLGAVGKPLDDHVDDDLIFTFFSSEAQHVDAVVGLRAPSLHQAQAHAAQARHLVGLLVDAYPQRRRSHLVSSFLVGHYTSTGRVRGGTHF